MTKHQKFDVLPNLDRRSFLVGTAATGLVSAVRRVSVLSRPGAIGVGRDTTNHLHAAPRLDQCGRSILPGILIEPGRWQSRHREVRHRLSRREPPVAYRQLTAG